MNKDNDEQTDSANDPIPRDVELEQLLLKESIVSVTGVTNTELQIGIRGDPSMRETTFDRQRYCSPVDNYFDELKPHLEELLLNRSTYRLYIGFNNGEIRTCSIFDPLREEIHSAEKLVEDAYLDRHFPLIGYEEKIELIREVYQLLEKSKVYNRVPAHWKHIMLRRNAEWDPMERTHIESILETLNVLRDIQQYYLRNVTICIMQDIVRMQFNCDGTQIINADNYKQFLQDNLIS
ncbi:hypothetical protein MNBD_GAMMA12-815 [hydrothermal vent metagenome]|uniref:Uncharacterized protein n=1 Tax=hydrothermal vent metagenome TaxID=652676 RepID=A0A3B0YZA0_9ZZZZ